MKSSIPSSGSARGLRLAIVVSEYHADITDALRLGAVSRFKAAGGDEADLTMLAAPGAFELIAIAKALADRGDVDGIVTLGCIITGETTHDQYIANAVAGGLKDIVVQSGIPAAFGVLTCQNLEQARSRAGGATGNKGEEAMAATIAAANAVRSIAASQEAAV